jgi:hypothetical protein
MRDAGELPEPTDDEPCAAIDAVWHVYGAVKAPYLAASAEWRHCTSLDAERAIALTTPLVPAVDPDLGDCKKICDTLVPAPQLTDGPAEPPPGLRPEWSTPRADLIAELITWPTEPDANPASDDPAGQIDRSSPVESARTAA